MKKIIIIGILLLFSAEMMLFDRFGLVNRINSLFSQIEIFSQLPIRNNLRFLFFSSFLFSILYLLRAIKVDYKLKAISLILIGLTIHTSPNLAFFQIDFENWRSSGRLYMYLLLISMISFLIYSFKHWHNNGSTDSFMLRDVFFDLLAILSIFSIVYAGGLAISGLNFGFFNSFLLDRFGLQRIYFFNGYLMFILFILFTFEYELNGSSRSNLNLIRLSVIILAFVFAGQHNNNADVFFSLKFGIWLLLILQYYNFRNEQLTLDSTDSN